MQEYQIPRRRWGDRYDGWRLRRMDPFFKLIPHIMRHRSDSDVHFTENIDLVPIEAYVRRLRNEGHRDIRIIHVVLAAIVRVISQKPGINRFIAGRRIYARNSITISFAIKRGMTAEAAESTLRTCFKPTDTLFDVAARINEQFRSFAGPGAESHTDTTAKVIGAMPSGLVRLIVFAARNLDKVGLMPKAVHEASPFHCSVFLTDVGSLGIGSVHHHLYEFGTCSVFVGMGKKESHMEPSLDGGTEEKRSIHFGFVVDERICDGFYYASAIKSFRRILQKPEQLALPPESVVIDPNI